MRILECEQNSPEWFKARMGMPTASEFATVMASGKDGGASKTRQTYMFKLAGEIITGDPMDNAIADNPHVVRGHAMEGEARDLYSFMNDVEPRRVGFIVDEKKRCGCSPDSLIGEDGAAEFKSKLPHLLIPLLVKNEFPPDHKAQCQGILWVGQREWIDLAVYWPKMPLFVKKAQREEAYIAKLASEVDRFNDELAALVERIKRYGDQRAAA